MSQSPKNFAREDQAKAEIGVTNISSTSAWIIIAIFLATILTVPIKDQFAGGYHAWKIWISPTNQPRAKAFETALEQNSVVDQAVRPFAQRFLTKVLSTGSENVDVGRDGWLFWDLDVLHVAGRGFLQLQSDSAQSYRKRQIQSARQADPLPAIFDFARQLKSRGIQLIIVPTPVKPMIHPEKLWPSVQTPIENESMEQFKREVEAEGIFVFDPTNDLAKAARQGTPQYLARDTHWLPEAMDLTAQNLADFVLKQITLPQTLGVEYHLRDSQITGRGDLDISLDVGAKPQTVTIQQVVRPDGNLWTPDENSPILFLGDSFSNIYSADQMKWGTSAGFAEQFSYHLGRPVDALRRNDNGSYATRQMLAGELAAGNDRLAGKKLVIWQFADRELSTGDWKQIELTLKPKSATRVIVPPVGEIWTIKGTVSEMGTAPHPGSAAYTEHILGIHLTDVTVEGRDITGAQAIVYVKSMTGGKLTPAAALQIGQKIQLTIRDFSEVARQYESVNRSDVLNPELRAQPACWGELGK